MQFKVIYYRLFLLTLFVCGCNRSEKINNNYILDYFVFSYVGGSVNYSIKFTYSDTIFIERRYFEKSKTYYGIINNKDKISFINFINKTQLSNLNSRYTDNYLQDGIRYKFYLVKNNVINSVFVYGRKAPQELYVFANWLESVKDKTEIHPINRVVNFGDLEGIVLPSFRSE